MSLLVVVKNEVKKSRLLYFGLFYVYKYDQTKKIEILSFIVR